MQVTINSYYANCRRKKVLNIVKAQNTSNTRAQNHFRVLKKSLNITEEFKMKITWISIGKFPALTTKYKGRLCMQ